MEYLLITLLAALAVIGTLKVWDPGANRANRWTDLATAVLPPAFAIFALLVHHKPWMLLSLGFLGFGLLSDFWILWLPWFRQRKTPAPATEAPAATAEAVHPSRLEIAFALLCLACIGLGAYYYNRVPASACVFCVKDITLR